MNWIYKLDLFYGEIGLLVLLNFMEVNFDETDSYFNNRIKKRNRAC